MYTVNRAIQDYQLEIRAAKEWAASGRTHINGRAVPEELAGQYGPEGCTVDDYIRWWTDRLARLEELKAAGQEDASEYNY